MPVTQGTLEKKEQEIIRRNRIYLVDNMDVTNFMDYCVDVDFLTITEVIELDDEKLTRKEQNRKFLDFLDRSGDGAYKKFVKLLNEHGGEEIANQLEQTEIGPVQESEATQESTGTYIQLTDKQKDFRLNSQNLLKFAAAVPLTEISSFGFALGLTSNQIDVIKLDHPGVATQRIYILNKWLQKKGRNATVGAMVEGFINAHHVGVNVDWNVVQNAVEKITEV